jgi:DNA-binding CsgD family transcriptional regulator/tetratricopeptide (TPR) repeat protein
MPATESQPGIAEAAINRFAGRVSSDCPAPNDVRRYHPPVDNVGRVAERQHLIAKLDRARAGLGTATIVRGPAGIGKSSLLNEIAGLAEPGYQVVFAVGNPEDQATPFRVVRLVLSALGRVNDLPPTLSQVFQSSLGSQPASLTVLGAELVALLSEAGVARPILIVIDDLQWVDPSSAAVLMFTARKLLADSVAMVFGLRTSDGSETFGSNPSGPYPWSNTDGIDIIELGRLSDVDSATLLARSSLSAANVHRAVAASSGVPLLLREFASQFVLIDAFAHDETIDLPAIYLDRVGGLSPETSRFCAGAAMEQSFPVLVDLFGPDANLALLEAERAEILTLSGATVRFRHPLLRASALRATAPDDLRDLHRSFAALMTCGPHLDEDRGALHIAHAAIGPDEPAALAVYAFAERAIARGGVSEAVQALSLAVQLTADRERRGRWLLTTAFALMQRGDSEAAIAVCEQIYLEGHDIGPDLDRCYVGATKWSRDPSAIVDRFHREAKDVTVAVARRAALLNETAEMAYLYGDIAGGVVDAESSIELAEASGELLTGLLARANLIWNLALSADTSRFSTDLAPIVDGLRSFASAGTRESIGAGHGVAMIALMHENWQLVDEVTRLGATNARLLGDGLGAVLFDSIRSSFLFRTGRWREAAALAESCLTADLTRVSFVWTSSGAAITFAATGGTRAAELAKKALEEATALNIPFLAIWANSALGLGELSEGRAAAALPYLDDAASKATSIGLHEPAFVLWRGDHIDALIETGRLDEAGNAVAELQTIAERTGRRYARGVVARSLGRLAGGSPAALDLFATALRIFEELESPFEIARTLLARAEHTSNGGGTPTLPGRNAASDLDEAERLFARLGATPWLRRVERLRIANGSDASESRSSTRQHDQPDLSALLTPAETRVAFLAAAGRTNKQIAAELYVSAKTVEFHLTSMYSKLDVNNRVQFTTAFTRLLTPS